MFRSKARRALRVRALRLPLVLTLVSALGAGASLRGVMVPVNGTVVGASQVDMLVATTRKRSDPAEMFSGARGSAPSFANITHLYRFVSKVFLLKRHEQCGPDQERPNSEPCLV